MKNRIKLLFIAATVGMLFAAGCKNEKVDPIDNGVEGEETTINLVISNDQATQTRGSEGTDPAITAESKIDATKGLKVYVFDKNKVFKISQQLKLIETPVGSNVFTSDNFKINSGEYYFYVFANDDQANPFINPATSNLTDFINSPCAVCGVDDLKITVSEMFLQGTLWSKSEVVPEGGTAESPATISLNIGRLASKVTLKAIEYEKKSENLKGKFSDGKFRLGTIARKINTVGMCTEGKNPIGKNNVLVTSCVHTASHIGETEGSFNEADFIQYTKVWKESGNFFYATENTTALDGLNNQYFGNTTYIQIETVYTPGAEEVYNPTTLEVVTGSLTKGATFWTAKIVDYPSVGNKKLAGQRLFFNVKPVEGSSHKDIDIESVIEYTGGKNYHIFPIFDEKEPDPIMRNRVLRNHSYFFTVSKFNDIGSNENTVAPTDPVPTKSDIVIKVEVIPWEKVTGEVEVG